MGLLQVRRGQGFPHLVCLLTAFRKYSQGSLLNTLGTIVRIVSMGSEECNIPASGL
jgi:hypothetical protein